MADNAEEKRAYQRGYVAGRKRVADEQERWDRVHAEIHARRTERRDQFFCAALTGLLHSGGWTMDGEKTKNMNDYVELARRFASRAIEVMP